jgi:hypothetical protein
MTHIEATIIDHVPPASLEERRDTLASRLDTGFDTIEQARNQGKDIERWEQGWLKLLREYEEVCDQIASRPLASTA